jgi:cytochrome d ubiquinol oxidase subunit II
MPVIFMLLGLVFRGVAFEFRFKAEKSRPIWDYAFHFGSIVAAFMQGTILGTLVQGVRVAGRSFAGGAFDWLTAYSFMTGIALVFGYALLGATWLVMKTDGITQEWARKCASYVLGYVGFFLIIVTISMPLMNSSVKALWFSPPTLFYLVPIPVLTAVLFILIWRDLHGEKESRPFFASMGVFVTGYIGLGISLWPWVVPFQITFRHAAAAATSQSFLLVGTIVILPVILVYTAFCYYVFRGKASHEGAY